MPANGGSRASMTEQLLEGELPRLRRGSSPSKIPPGQAYAELHAHSFFSLLDGASSPEALVARAKALGLRALALTDHDSLAGAVRFWTAAQKEGLPAIIGAELSLDDDSHLTLLAETPRGYANLCRLITRGHGAAGTDVERTGRARPRPARPGRTWPRATRV
ncbi:MAG: PHP domain-containing protein [Anaerolineae bacterium]|nr:PHP domain-containing protein [Anaerolineae bacterium]